MEWLLRETMDRPRLSEFPDSDVIDSEDVTSVGVATAAEVFVSITCLEFSYTQAPKKMKSLVMACFLLSVSLGNVFVSVVNLFIQNDDGSSKLAGPDYYLFFAACMFVTAVLFIPVALWYKEKTYIQDERDAVSA